MIKYNRHLQSEHEKEITIKFSSGGEQEIIYNDFILMPDFVYINENSINIQNKNKITISSENDIVKFGWINNNLTNCSKMFYNLGNIIEVNLSKFEFSNIESIGEMFYNCSNLKKIIFPNSFDTPSLTSMYKTFTNCESLQSLDLSNFNTSLVSDMDSLFDGCSSLQSLDISSFDIE